MVSTSTISFAPASSAVGIDLLRKSRSARVPSTPKNATRMPFCAAIADGVVARANRFVAGNAVGLQLDIAGGNFDHGGLQSQPHQLFHVAASGARESPYFGVLQTCAAGSARWLRRLPAKLSGNPASIRPTPSSSSFLRDLELLLRTEDDADRLLAVAQRGVVEANRCASDRSWGERPDASSVRWSRLCRRTSSHRATLLRAAAQPGGFSP